MKFDSAATEK